MSDPLVYLAGPFFNEAQISGIRALEGAIESQGYKCHSPCRDGIVVKPDAPMEDRLQGFGRNVQEIRDSDLIVAWVDWLLPAGQQVRVVQDLQREIPMNFPPNIQQVIDAGCKVLGVNGGRDRWKTLVLPGELTQPQTPKSFTVMLHEPTTLCNIVSHALNIPDPGTVFEIGAGYALGKPIVGVSMIGGKVNLMLSIPTLRICETPDELKQTLTEIRDMVISGEVPRLQAYQDEHRHTGTVE